MPDEVTISRRSESVMRPVSVARNTTVFRARGGYHARALPHLRRESPVPINASYLPHCEQLPRHRQSHMERKRTVTWQDPARVGRASLSLAGAAFLRAIVDRTLPPPPIAELMGFDIEEVGEGRVVFGVQPQEYHYNPIGMVHGGLAATLLDSAMGCAVHSLLPEGRAYTTLELKVNFIRPLKHDIGRVRAIGKVIHIGGKVATAEGSVVDAAGKLYTHATTTCLLMDVSAPVA